MLTGSLCECVYAFGQILPYVFFQAEEGMVFFFQAEDGIRDLVRSRGLGDVYKRQELTRQGISLP